MQWVTHSVGWVLTVNLLYAGGLGDWRTSTTIPNILRQFNPNLIGFSVGIVKIYVCYVLS